MLAAIQIEAPSAADVRGEIVLFQQSYAVRDLLESCTHMMGIGLNCPADTEFGTLEIRTTQRLTIDSLYALTNRKLMDQGLACIQAPGESTLTVVHLDHAASLARLERGDVENAKAGYVKAFFEAQAVPPKDLLDAIRSVLTDKGSITVLAASDAILISDLKPHVLQALSLLDYWEAIQSDIVVKEIEVRHMQAIELAALVERVNSAKKQVLQHGPRGKVVASPETGTILIVAPPREVAALVDIVRQFDRPAPAETRHYSPMRISLGEAAKLIEASARVNGGEGLQLAEDPSTGTLSVTASPAAHRRVRDLLDRVDALPAARDALRIISVKHRGVSDVFELVEKFLEHAPPQGGTGGPIEPVEGPTAGLVRTLEAGAATTGGPHRASTLMLQVDEGTNRIIARGTPRELDEVEELVRKLDVRHSQVLVEVLIVTLSEMETHDLGVELQKIGTSGDTMVQLASLFGLRSPDPRSALIPAAAGAGFGGVVLDPGSFSAVVRALDTVQGGRTSTMPKVLVDNNQEATLNSVLQSPFASTNASDTVATTSFGGTQDAGTTIAVKPQITEGEQLLLEYTISLSSFIGDSTDPALPPPRQENKLQSTATIPDGFTIAVGGLEIESDTEATTEVPLLGRIPILGALFRNRSQSSQRTRFFVFLRCSIMRSRGFENLKYMSGSETGAAGLPPDWPRLEARIIR